jgi:K+-sensing histidine kinase KdpD
MRAPPHQERWTERGSIGYGLAVVGTGLAAGLRYVLGLSFPELPPFITFYAFVVLSALVGGAGAGLLATALSAVAVTVFFLGPGANLHEVIPDEWLGLAVFCAINVVMSIVSGRVRTARRRVQAEAQAARIA